MSTVARTPLPTARGRQTQAAIDDAGTGDRISVAPGTYNEALDMGGKAISIALKSGEIWVLRHESLCDMAIKPSVYLENGRLRPRAAQQVVLTGRAMSYATQIRWSLAKAQDTPNALRDYADATEEEETETADD